MSWKREVLFLYMICSVSTIRGMVLENLNKPGKDFRMPVEISDENFDEFVSPQQNPINPQFFQNLVEPWPQENIPVLYIQDELSDFSTFSDNASENDYSPNVFLSAMKRSGYNRKLQQRKTQQAKNNPFILVCTPTREEIFRLLVAVTEMRDANTERIVNICNKKRPIKIVVRNSRNMAK